ncbi:SecY-interacting protein [Erwinia sp. CPCC 100877]|nr:SecY-interacting protein [Erwinia sp. CPCC 100877]
MSEVQQALVDFTRRYCDAWRQQKGGDPQSHELYGIPSPCIVTTEEESVRWRPAPFTLAQNLDAVERALEIRICDDARVFYTTQFAGDMTADFGTYPLTLLQPWSEDDFLRLQENLIGHLVTRKRLKLVPTLFLATLESELEVLSLVNLTGEVVLEKLGTAQHQVLAPSLCAFLQQLQPRC